jgi:hypothetical protein
LGFSCFKGESGASITANTKSKFPKQTSFSTTEMVNHFHEPTSFGEEGAFF